MFSSTLSIAAGAACPSGCGTTGCVVRTPGAASVSASGPSSSRILRNIWTRVGSSAEPPSSLMIRRASHSGFALWYGRSAMSASK
jgi:hypothetical protein